MIKSPEKRSLSTLSEDAPINKRRRTIFQTWVIESAFISLSKVYRYNPVSMNFNNITRWSNITDLNISRNKLIGLPTKLGSLHCLQRLDVSHNCLHQYGWEWLKESRIKKTLRFLNISYNSLFQASEYIWELNALEELNMSHNYLGKNLPFSQGIETLRRLSILNLSHNSITYLPRGLNYMRLHTINISMNPVTILTSWKLNTVMPRLVEFAAKTLQQYCKKNHVIFQSNIYNEYVNRNLIHKCYKCKKICSYPYVQAGTPVKSIFEIAENVISHALVTENVLYEYCFCLEECKKD